MVQKGGNIQNLTNTQIPSNTNTAAPSKIQVQAIDSYHPNKSQLVQKQHTADEGYQEDKKNVVVVEKVTHEHTTKEFEFSENILSQCNEEDDVEEEQYDERNFIEVKQLGSGQSFGEMALKNLNNSTRAATIVCLSDCDVVTLNRQDYKKILEKIDDKILEFDLKFLKAMPYFSKWSQSMLRKLHSCFQKIRVMKDHVVIKEGVTCEYLYMVKSGIFELSKRLKRAQLD